MGEKDEGCKCSTVTARTWLIIFNSVFVILGLAVAASGGIVLWGRDLVNSYLADMLEEVSVQGGSLDDLLRTVGIALLLAGVLLLAVGVMGWSGACCLVKCSLMIIEDKVKGALQTTIDTFYAGDSGTDAVSLGFNFLFVQLDCCGIDIYTDLYSASNWNRSFSGGYTLQTPFTCCQLDGTFPNVVIPPSDVMCAVTPNATNSNYGTGCYEAFFDYITNYQLIFIIVGVCLFVCEVCSAVSAFILKKHAAQQNRRVDSVPSTPAQKAGRERF
ncbi:uncharacterized protein LOC143286658 [Babylonia areolata]|uniref:uncharacterized protein LOC143286658 n=1 Tax=Babylonia areolata TaxID=304850 RepID=UPI003FCF4588